jgi:DNA-binding transcriptional MerR regulator
MWLKGKDHRMLHEILFTRLDVIIKEIARLDKENPTGPDEETDPRIVALLDEAQEIQKELDPLMRETFRNDPAKLAEWESIMHMCDDLDEEDTDKPT